MYIVISEAFAVLKNVIFDFGGVICEYNPDDILARFFEEEDRDFVKGIIYRNWAGLDAGTLDYDEYICETLNMIPERLKGTMLQFFRKWHRTLPHIEQTWALIGRLKARGYNVYLLSNAPVEFANDLNLFPIMNLMDGVVVSGCIQMVKPHAEIFEYALRKFGIAREETLFVDDMEINVNGARACGLYGYLYSGDADNLLKYIESLTE